MRRQLKSRIGMALVLLTALTGCHPIQPKYLRETGDLSHYLDKVTDLEHPDVDTERLAEVDQAETPFTVSSPEFREIWEIGLEECIHIAMQNSKVIRNAGSIQANFGFSDALIERTAQLPTAYDPALVETTPGQGSRYGGSLRGGGSSTNFFGSGLQPNGVGLTNAVRSTSVGGVEDALAEFDAQFYSGFNFQNTNRASNFLGAGALQQQVTEQQNGTFETAIAKKTASGAYFRLSSKTDSNVSNQGLAKSSPTGLGRTVAGAWTQVLEAEMRFPLMRGRGEQINRLPIVLARINTDISLADFEAGVRNMLMDVENAYWDLYYSYRNLEAAKIGRDSAQATWKNVYEKKKFGALADQDEAQAKGQYFQFRGAVETALKDLYNTENRLRWLMGLAATDGRLIRPKDEPTTARVEFEWAAIHGEALFRSTELRQQKWRLKQRELEMLSARNTLLPILTASTGYRQVGVGDRLINADRNGTDFVNSNDAANAANGSTAFDELTGGKYGEAFVVLDFLPPQFGARRELSAVRNAELAIARAKAHLEEMELNLSHLMTSAVRDLDANYSLAQTNFNWWASTQKEVEAFEALYQGGKSTLDLVLEAQRKRAQAQVQYYRSLTDYNKSLSMVHYRKGSLLEHNNVFMAEGPWPQKAYWDAIDKARQRDAGRYVDYGWTRPGVVSRGAIEQHNGQSEEGARDPNDPLPTPKPAPEDSQDDPADAPQNGPVTLNITPAAKPLAALPRTLQMLSGERNSATERASAAERPSAAERVQAVTYEQAEGAGKSSAGSSRVPPPVVIDPEYQTPGAGNRSAKRQ
jgi:outer membrane protein TolC